MSFDLLRLNTLFSRPLCPLGEMDESPVPSNECPYPTCVEQSRESCRSSHYLCILFSYSAVIKRRTSRYNLQETTVRPFRPSISDLIRLSAFITVYAVLIRSPG
jgi:hypothetical protein